MKWSPQQDAALVAVHKWLQDPGGPQVMRVFGFAGTGKTTMAIHLAEGVEGEVIFCAYTGKAAYVLRQKGCVGATTIHSQIYHTRSKGKAALAEMELQLTELRAELREEGVEDLENHQRVQDLKVIIDAERDALSQPSFIINPESPVRDAELVVVDECSMVDGRMGEDLLMFNTKVLVLGDPAQLPPVMGGGFFTENVEPDIMLTEIHRQAAGNPIIAMATKVRNKEALDLGSYGESCVIDISDIKREHAQEADQILVGRNKTRHMYNNRMRELMEYRGVMPEPGDKLVCLRNNHDKGLLNGALWHVDDVAEIDTDRIYMTLISDIEGEYPLEVTAHTHHFKGREGHLTWWERNEAEEFDYGYALTVHKAQGSQWKDVLLFDESYCFRADRWRWLYTGITRASGSVRIVRM